MPEEEINSFIQSLVNEEASEDTIFTSVAEHTGKGIIHAVRLFKKFQKDTGLVMSPAQRKEKIVELFDASLNENDEVSDYKALVENVATTLGITKATAQSNVKAICEAKGVKVPELSSVLGEVNTWLINHPNAERKEFNSWMKDTGRKESTTSAYWSALLFAKRCHVAWSAANVTPQEA